MENLLWSEDEIRVSPEGFLFVVEPQLYSLEEEEQPILLHTTAVLLRELYPSREIHEVFSRSGFESEETTSSPDFVDESFSPTSKSEKKGNDNLESNSWKSIPAEYRIYQELERIENLANRIHSALQDIRNFRHRIGGCRSDSSRDSEKIRALQMQQNHLLGSTSESNSENSKTVGQIVTKRTDRGQQKPRSEESVSVDGEDDNDNAYLGEELIVIKLARTINSIRALFPHLLPILNHERRNDKKLVIGKTRYKTRRNGEMCWLLGTETYSSCTVKQVFMAQEDTKQILESFIGVEGAAEISRDSKGSPSYWSAQKWIEHLVKHSNPVLSSPLTILLAKSSADEDSIMNMALSCDKIIVAHEKASTEGMDQQYKKAVRKIHQRLSNVLTSRFHGARLSIYGSCLSNLALGKASDVDMSLWIPAAENLKNDFENGSIDARQYDQSMKKLVYQVFRKLSKLKAEFRAMTPITKARIPVISGTYNYAGNPYTEDGSIDFDICFLNDIAVANSNLLREYSLVDPKVRSMMITVKQWAKEQNINSAKEKCISSYSWMNLVIFYLQCMGFLPNLQCPTLMKAAGIVPDREGNHWHFVNKLDTCTMKWEDIKDGELWAMPSEFAGLPLSLLLYGFFEFYGLRFPFGTHAVSIKRASICLSKLATKKINFFLSIEDPFETYDSFCPHDLGSPANAFGSTKIRNCLQDAEEHLRMILCSGEEPGDRLWPQPPFVEPEPTRNKAKRSGFKRFEPPMAVIADDPDSNYNNLDKPIGHATNDVEGDQHRHKHNHFHAGRGRGRGKSRSRRGRYDRSKDIRAPQMR